MISTNETETPQGGYRRRTSWSHVWEPTDAKVSHCRDCGARGDTDGHEVCSGSPEYKRIYDLGLAAGRQEQDQQIAEVCRNCGCQEVGR